MTTWYSRNGWGWCNTVANIPAMVLLWGAVITATVLAVRFLTRQRSDPLAPRDMGSIRIEYMLAEGSARGEMDNDEWHRRLM
jgi:putative membrane protein